MTLRNDMICVYIVRPDSAGQLAEFLQLKRRQDDYLGGTWQTVYGTLEPGETAVEGALRELREETSLVPREFYRVAIAPAIYTAINDTTWVVPAFCALVSRDDQVVLNDEHSAFRWVARCEVIEAFMWASDHAAIESVCADILDNSPAKPYLKIP